MILRFRSPLYFCFLPLSGSVLLQVKVTNSWKVGLFQFCIYFVFLKVTETNSFCVFCFYHFLGLYFFRSRSPIHGRLVFFNFVYIHASLKMYFTKILVTKRCKKSLFSRLLYNDDNYKRCIKVTFYVNCGYSQCKKSFFYIGYNYN